MTEVSKTILLIGAGHAHLHVITRAREFANAGAQLTLVSPEPFWYYPGMAGEVLSGYYGLADFRVDLRSLTEKYGVNYIADEVTHMLPEHRKVLTLSGRALDYDLSSCAIGAIPAESEGDVPVDGSYPLSPVRSIIEIRNEVETLLELEPDRMLTALILGGGPGGVETALNLTALLRERAPVAGWSVMLLEAKARVLSAFSMHASRLAARKLARAKVEVRTGAEIQHVQSGRVVLDRGETLNFDLAVVALGSRVSDLFTRAGLLTDDAGALLVERTLRLRDHPELFAAGDCAHLWGLGLSRCGVHAIAQGPVLAHNLLAVLRGRPLEAYHRSGTPLQMISLGPAEGLLVRGRWAFRGRWVRFLKHRLDRAYVRRYQVPPAPAASIPPLA